jgi:hypothetical protein
MTGVVRPSTTTRRIFDRRAGLGIDAAELHLAEIRVPDTAAGIEDHAVRLDRRPQQTIFGDHW